MVEQSESLGNVSGACLEPIASASAAAGDVRGSSIARKPISTIAAASTELQSLLESSIWEDASLCVCVCARHWLVLVAHDCFAMVRPGETREVVHKELPNVLWKYQLTWRTPFACRYLGRVAPLDLNYRQALA